MSTICIVSGNQIESKKIQELLDNLDLEVIRRPRFETLRPAQLTEQLEPHIDLLVYNYSLNLNMNLKQQVMTWRQRGFLGSIIVISKVTDFNLLAHMNTLHNFVVLEKPFEDKDLNGIAYKFLSTIKVNQRRFRRFNTVQNVEVECYKNSEKYGSKVQNISLGGLCLEGDWSRMDQGDLVKVHFPLDQIKREYTMNAKVVWIGRGSAAEVGLEFVNDEEVYNQLLDSMG